MADWTPLQAIIWACPPPQATAVLELLAERNLRPAGWLDGTDTTATLALGQLYLSPAEALGSAARETAAALLEAAPGVAFEVWEDPAYGQLGTLVAHVPEVGTLTQRCNAEGTALWTAQEVLALLEIGPALRPDPLLTALDRLRAELAAADPAVAS